MTLFWWVFDSCLLNLSQVARAGRFGTKGLAISFVSSEEDVKILNSVQDRFQVNVTEMPFEIDVNSYSKSLACLHSSTLLPMLHVTILLRSSQGVGHPWALSVQFGAECCAVVYPQHVRCGPSATLDINITPHLTLSTLCGRSSGRSGHVIVYSLCFPEPLAGTDWGDKPYNGHRVIAFLSLLHASICWTMDLVCH